ncbi:MAG: TnpV protein [Coprobacillus cateniformis]
MKGGIMMSITYTRKGDYEIPDLAIPENKIQVEGKYAMMRLRYLKENKKSLYTTLLMSNQLPEHLMNIQEVAMERVEQIVSEMKAKEKITEQMKQQDPMKWIGLMNILKTSAEEIVANELIYA